MKSKKGAIEISMTTIIIIVVGVVLLSLALMWVRDFMGKIQEVTKSAFEQTDAEISRIFRETDRPLTLSPKEIDVEKYGAETVEVIITNFEGGSISVQARATSTEPTTLDCSFADTMTPNSKPYSIESGEQALITLIIDEKGGNLGRKVCNIEVNGVGGDNTESLVIDVTRKRGVFD